jgi:hypothetical protein
MNDINTLAKEVSTQTGSNLGLIEAVIRVHQDRFPGSWQEWTVKGKTLVIAKIMLDARKNRESAPERMVPNF